MNTTTQERQSPWAAGFGAKQNSDNFNAIANSAKSRRVAACGKLSAMTFCLSVTKSSEENAALFEWHPDWRSA